jgi:hypothetical protein
MEMNKTKWALLTLPLAFVLWYFTFAIEWGIFWFKLAPSAALLALIGLSLSRDQWSMLLRFKPGHLLIGPLSAALLYGVFWLGNILSQQILPSIIPNFDPSAHIQNVYANKTQLDLFYIGLLLLFVMGPAEEIYWRGFLQRVLGERFNKSMRIVLATSAYALVHLVAMNPMLLVAAAICGLFWGWLYEHEESLIPVILSHSLWDLAIFVVFPLK